MLSRSLYFVLAPVLLAALGIAWLEVAPSTVGGGATYLRVSGSSMNPSFVEGDLVVVRSGGRYEVGDIVAYQDRLLGATVIHRIVDRDGDRYVAKGDNNDWLDEYRPSESDIVGLPWIRLPGFGNHLAHVGSPLFAAAIPSVAGAFSIGGIFAARKRRQHSPGSGTRRADRRPGQRNRPLPPASDLLVIGLVAVAVPFGVLSLLAFTRPSEEIQLSSVGYTQSGEFNYSAGVQPGPVYDRPLLASGEPIFRNLVQTIEVGFTYRFSAVEPHAISGTGTLRMELSDKAGWKRTFNLQPTTPFTGDELTLVGSIDLATVDKALEDFEALSGVSRDLYTLSVVADLEAGGKVAAQSCCNAFSAAPRLVFLRRPLQLLPTADGLQPADSLDYLKSTVSGEVQAGHLEPNRLSLLGMGIGVREARILGLAGMLAPLMLAAVLGYALSRNAPRDEAARIQRAYGRWLIAAEPAQPALSGRRVQLTNMVSLVRLAERLDSVVFHMQEDGGAVHTYVVYDGNAAFTHQVRKHRQAERDDAEDTAA